MRKDTNTDLLITEISWSPACIFYTERWGVSIFAMLDEKNELKFVKIMDDQVETLLKVTPKKDCFD